VKHRHNPLKLVRFTPSAIIWSLWALLGVGSVAFSSYVLASKYMLPMVPLRAGHVQVEQVTRPVLLPAYTKYTKITVEVGDLVQQGQVLITLDQAQILRDIGRLKHERHVLQTKRQCLLGGLYQTAPLLQESLNGGSPVEALLNTAEGPPSEDALRIALATAQAECELLMHLQRQSLDELVLARDQLAHKVTLLQDQLTNLSTTKQKSIARKIAERKAHVQLARELSQLELKHQTIQLSIAKTSTGYKSKRLSEIRSLEKNLARKADELRRLSNYQNRPHVIAAFDGQVERIREPEPSMRNTTDVAVLQISNPKEIKISSWFDMPQPFAETLKIGSKTMIDIAGMPDALSSLCAKVRHVEPALRGENDTSLRVELDLCQNSIEKILEAKLPLFKIGKTAQLNLSLPEQSLGSLVRNFLNRDDIFSQNGKESL